mmetsp:Transcript_12757/g.32229  ORF Transcript_12757/g.32229 Transcript_12757/m.32229 type:complete len:262 (-) Transcript_12757:4-789(-)
MLEFRERDFSTPHGDVQVETFQQLLHIVLSPTRLFLFLFFHCGLLFTARRFQRFALIAQPAHLVFELPVLGRHGDDQAVLLREGRPLLALLEILVLALQLVELLVPVGQRIRQQCNLGGGRHSRAHPRRLQMHLGANHPLDRVDVQARVAEEGLVLHFRLELVVAELLPLEPILLVPVPARHCRELLPLPLDLLLRLAHRPVALLDLPGDAELEVVDFPVLPNEEPVALLELGPEVLQVLPQRCGSLSLPHPPVGRGRREK